MDEQNKEMHKEYIECLPEEEKVCTSCSESKPGNTEYFYVQAATVDGLTFSCKDCIRSKRLRRKQMMPITSWARRRYWSMQGESKKLMTVDLIKDIFKRQDGCCIYCGIECDPIGKKYQSNGATLDRVLNHIGYLPDNVVMACRDCNALKRDATIEKLEKFLRVMRECAVKHGSKV